MGERIAGSRIGQRCIQAWRYAVARDILRFPPLRLPSEAHGPVSIHVLTSTRDWLMAIWMLRSFFRNHPNLLPVFLHDDGSLSRDDHAALTHALPGAKIIERAAMDQVANERLAAFPRCRRWRQENWMTLKLFDPWLCCESEGVLLFDSDLLFFAPPVEVAEWIAGPKTENRWNQDVSNFYTLSAEEIRSLTGIAVQAQINCGLGLVARASIDFGLVEELLRQPGMTATPWLVEQTAYATMSSRFGVRLLPRRYLIDTDPQGELPEGLVCKHYVNVVRGLFYRQGIRTLRPRLRAA